MTESSTLPEPAEATEKLGYVWVASDPPEDEDTKRIKEKRERQSDLLIDPTDDFDTVNKKLHLISLTKDEIQLLLVPLDNEFVPSSKTSVSESTRDGSRTEESRTVDITFPKVSEDATDHSEVFKEVKNEEAIKSGDERAKISVDEEFRQQQLRDELLRKEKLSNEFIKKIQAFDEMKKEKAKEQQTIIKVPAREKEEADSFKPSTPVPDIKEQTAQSLLSEEVFDEPKREQIIKSGDGRAKINVDEEFRQQQLRDELLRKERLSNEFLKKIQAFDEMKKKKAQEQQTIIKVPAREKEEVPDIREGTDQSLLSKEVIDEPKTEKSIKSGDGRVKINIDEEFRKQQLRDEWLRKERLSNEFLKKIQDFDEMKKKKHEDELKKLKVGDELKKTAHAGESTEFTKGTGAKSKSLEEERIRSKEGMQCQFIINYAKKKMEEMEERLESLGDGIKDSERRKEVLKRHLYELEILRLLDKVFREDVPSETDIRTLEHLTFELKNLKGYQ